MKAKPSTDEEMVDKLDSILFDVPHSNDPRAYSDGYDILDMIEGYENKAREILKLSGYPLTVREIIHSRFDKDGVSLGKKPLPRKIRDAMDMLQSFHMVRVHIKENDISFALGFMAYGVHAAAKLQIRPLKPLIDMGKKWVGSGENGGNISADVRQKKARSVHEVRLSMAEEIWQKHPKWKGTKGKDTEVARKIKKKIGGNIDTIRKSIRKPLP